MAIETKPPVQTPADPVIEEMTRAGVQFGHKTSKTHPKMKPYIAGIRNTVHIFNLEKTKEKLQEALDFISSLVKEGKVLLLVGTKVQIKNLVKETAVACSVPYVNERWLGGTFTNFETISKRITELIDLEKKKEAGEFAKYTKKEQGGFEERIRELEVKYGGLRALTKVPDAVFICDLDKNDLVMREAKKKGVPVIAICDSNIDPAMVDYCIPANDDSQSAVQYILDRIKSQIINSKSEKIPNDQNSN